MKINLEETLLKLEQLIV